MHAKVFVPRHCCIPCIQTSILLVIHHLFAQSRQLQVLGPRDLLVWRDNGCGQGLRKMPSAIELLVISFSV